MIPPSTKGHNDETIFPATVVVVGNIHDAGTLRYQVHGHINVNPDINYTSYNAAYTAAVQHSRTVKEEVAEVDTKWEAEPLKKATLHSEELVQK